MLAQAVLNFNSAYTSQYGAAPTSGSSTNWAQQMEYDRTQPPASLSIDVLNLMSAIGQAAPTSSQGLNGVATAINNIVSGLDAMGSPLDPAEQILLWTLTLPTDPSDPNSSLEGAAQAALQGDPVQLTSLLNQMAGGGAGSEAQWINIAAQNFYSEQLPYSM